MIRMERCLQVGILLAFILFSYFYKLDSLSYRIWDEAHLFNNACEMSKTGNLIVTTLNYQPDMDCTKPPLMVWAQAACIRLNGINEYSCRFPAATCALLTTLLIFYIVLRITKNGWAALLAGIVLCTAGGYIGHHGARFGEYDPMLALFSTIALLCFFMYTEAENKKRNWYLFLFFVALTLGVLTKGVAILMFGPMLLIYLIIRKQFRVTILNKYFYAGLGFFLLFGVGYYFLRESMNPGYLQAVYNNELGGRYLEVNQGHVGPFRYYYDYIRGERFGNWYWALPTALILLPFNDDEKRKRLSAFLFLCSVGFLLILSAGASKLFWYDLPLYPLFAIIIAIVMLQLADYVSWGLSFLKPNVALILLIILFAAQPVKEMHRWIGWPEEEVERGYYATSYYLRNKMQTGNKNLNNSYFINQAYMTYAWKPYIIAMNEQGHKINMTYIWDSPQLSTGDKIIVPDEITEKLISSHYTFTVLEQHGDARLYQIISPLNAH